MAFIGDNVDAAADFHGLDFTLQYSENQGPLTGIVQRLLRSFLTRNDALGKMKTMVG